LHMQRCAIFPQIEGFSGSKRAPCAGLIHRFGYHATEGRKHQPPKCAYPQGTDQAMDGLDELASPPRNKLGLQGLSDDPSPIE
jgi:hypothetical protein